MRIRSLRTKKRASRSKFARGTGIGDLLEERDEVVVERRVVLDAARRGLDPQAVLPGLPAAQGVGRVIAADRAA